MKKLFEKLSAILFGFIKLIYSAIFKKEDNEKKVISENKKGYAFINNKNDKKEAFANVHAAEIPYVYFGVLKNKHFINKELSFAKGGGGDTKIPEFSPWKDT